MNSKKAVVIIKSSKQLKEELKDALTGKKRSIQKENEIVFNSVESFMKILSASRLEILIYLNNHSPKSIYELAKGVHRDFKNVHSDVKKLDQIGLIELKEGKNTRGSLIPCAKYSGIELSLVA